MSYTPKRIVAVDSQKLDALASCMYMYKLKFGTPDAAASGKQPIIVPDYFERGDLVHTLMEAYYKMKAHRSRWKQNKRTHADVVQAAINVARWKASKMALDIAEVEMVIDAFLQYAEHFENDNWTDSNIVFVEKVGSKVLYDDPTLLILYEVKIDMGLKLNGNLTPVDHKSAKARRDPNALSNQFRGYCWFLGANTLIVNEFGFQKTLKPAEKFRRLALQFSDSQLNEWAENAIFWVKNGLELIDRNYYPQNFTSCDKYSGCIFKPTICQADPEVRDYKLQQFFKDRTWDVGGAHL